jgi:hypothetical protein
LAQFVVLVVVTQLCAAVKLISISPNGENVCGRGTQRSRDHRSAGELTPEEIERVMTVVTHPRQYKIPVWMLNRRKDFTTGKNSHNFSQAVDIVLRDDLERLKKIRVHR